jgi:limonene 1,2-monooxygenase
MSSIPLRHGIFLAPFHPTDEDPTLCIQRDLELCAWLDKLGYDEAWIGEHHSAGFEIISSPELFIAAAAERTKRIKLGTGVISLPYHNPLMAANRMIQLDHMTMGRAMFGVGPGLLTSDAMMLGIDPDKQRDRMVEALDLILRLMRGDTVTEKTEWYNLTDARVHLKPYSQPRPEICVASSRTPHGGRVAGQYGIGMLCVAATDPYGFDVLGTNWQIANEVAAEQGRTMDRSGLRLVGGMYIAETREQARKDVEFGLMKWATYFAQLRPLVPKDNTGRPLVDILTQDGSTVIGTPDDAIAMIERLYGKQGEFGAFLQLAHNWANWENTKKSYELFARHVMPHFRKSNTNRQASYDWMAQHAVEHSTKQLAAATKMFERHEAEQKAKHGGKAAE